MLCFKWFQEKLRRRSLYSSEGSSIGGADCQKQEEEPITVINPDEWEITDNFQLKFVYFTLMMPNQYVIDFLHESERNPQKFTNEEACVEYMKSINDKIFLIIDGEQSTSLIDLIQSLKQIDSIFFHSLSSDTITTICQKQHTSNLHFCKDISMLLHTISKSIEEIEQQIGIRCRYTKKEKAIYNLSKEQGSFLHFQPLKILLKNLPKCSKDITQITSICANYYRRNLIELANIDEFKQTYRSIDAIVWFTKETFINKLLNKTIRMQNFDLLCFFHFYIKDLSEQLEFKFEELKRKQRDALKLYRAVQLTQTELSDYQNSIGNIISNNEYLLTSCEYSVTNLTEQEGAARTIIEYSVDLNVVQNTILADVQQYSAFPEQRQFLIDIGGLFQIDSCEYNTVEDIWYIKVHATDQIADAVAEYIEHQQKKIVESSPLVSFGNLVIEIGEYIQAERYFDYSLISFNPNDEEISWIFYNLGRIHRLRGDFNRALNCYKRAYDLSINTRSKKRKASAGKAINGLGIVYLEQGRELKAEQCFQHAMQLYKKSLPKYHVDVAKTLLNLGTIDCNRRNFEQALMKFQQASEIYDRSLPTLDPDRAFVRINFGNVYFAKEDDQKALEEYGAALKLQQVSLPSDHPYIAQTLHNLALVYVRQKNIDETKICLKRAEEIAREYLPVKHPLMISIGQTKQLLLDEKQCSNYL